MRCLSKFSCVGFGMECQTHCHRGQNSRHSYQQHFTGAFISHPHKPFPLSVFLTLASLQWLCSDIQCFFKKCVSSDTNDVEYPFICLLGIWVSSKEMSTQIVCPCFYLVVCLLLVDLLDIHTYGQIDMGFFAYSVLLLFVS